MLKGRRTLDGPAEQVFPADLAARPRGERGPTWSQFLKAQASGIIACDFFTVETTFLKTLHVLFFIEIATGRVHLSVSTSSPDSVFVT
jgi:hypothetical protein